VVSCLTLLETSSKYGTHPHHDVTLRNCRLAIKNFAFDARKVSILSTCRLMDCILSLVKSIEDVCKLCLHNLYLNRIEFFNDISSLEDAYSLAT